MSHTVADIKKLLNEADVDEFVALERSLKGDTRKGVQQALEETRRRFEAKKVEEQRIGALYTYEASLVSEGSLIVGLDEVGRGALAGPLCVGAVVLDKSASHIAYLNDSKQLTPARRKQVSEVIQQTALTWQVVLIEPSYIDQNGMTAALRKAFTQAIKQVEDAGFNIDAVLLDGNPLHIDPREINVVKGDAKCASIAAASIVAKVYRDELMDSYSDKYPAYDLSSCKGYGSKAHRDAIADHGLTPIHRASFCTAFTQERLF